MYFWPWDYVISWPASRRAEWLHALFSESKKDSENILLLEFTLVTVERLHNLFRGSLFQVMIEMNVTFLKNSCTTNCKKQSCLSKTTNYKGPAFLCICQKKQNPTLTRMLINGWLLLLWSGKDSSANSFPPPPHTKRVHPVKSWSYAASSAAKYVRTMCTPSLTMYYLLLQYMCLPGSQVSFEAVKCRDWL